MLGAWLAASAGCASAGATAASSPAAAPSAQPPAPSAASTAETGQSAPLTAAPGPGNAGSPAGPAIARVPAPPPPRKIAVLALAASGIASATAGALLLIGAESRYATVRQLAVQTDRSCPAGNPHPTGLCAELRSTAAETDRMGNLGIGALVLGGLFGVGASVLILVPVDDPPAHPKRHTRLVPFASPEGGGAVLHGSF